MKPLPSTPLRVELLATADQLRTAPHRRTGYVEAEQFDFDDLLQVAPYVGDPPSKRKSTETARVLAILDSLERGDG
jgi:hypothetical protein